MLLCHFPRAELVVRFFGWRLLRPDLSSPLNAHVRSELFLLPFFSFMMDLPRLVHYCAWAAWYLALAKISPNFLKTDIALR